MKNEWLYGRKVNSKLSPAELEQRLARWEADAKTKGEHRPAAQIDDAGNLLGVDGILANGWRATYIAHLIEHHID